MPRPPSGQLLERKTSRGRTYAFRFRVGGRRQYVTLGTDAEGWTRRRAEEELERTLAAVKLGVWKPAQAEILAEPEPEATFHVFASEWLGAREAEGLAAKTLIDLHWSLERHLLPFFASHRLSEITPQEVDRYKTAKARERAAIETAREEVRRRGERFSERGLSNGSINHTLRHLSQILETGVEYGLIGSNAANGRRRRLKAATPARPWVEPEQLMALLDATSGVGRVLLAILAGGGLRIGEALALRWQHVELGTGSLHVVDSKTAKGIREVHLSPALREELALWRADADHTKPADYVIHTSTGRKHNPSNLRRDVLAPAVEAANAKLAEDVIAPIGPITFHSLRRTYASLRCVCGDDVRYTADQLGHEDPRFTLRVYAKATKRRDRLSGPHLKAYDRALEWALLGTTEPLDVPALQTGATKSPV
jgi:integrase